MPTGMECIMHLPLHHVIDFMKALTFFSYWPVLSAEKFSKLLS